jgi:hypothetical protein
VIAPFGLRHIWLMRELQSASAEFDLRGALLGEPATPLQAALRGYFLKSRSGVFTYVLRVSDRSPTPYGFAQARAEHSGLAWNIVRMAPVLDHSEDAATVWYRLLLHLCIAAGECQVQRLLVRLAEGSAAEDVFRQASFVTYSHEQVFCRQPAKGAGRLSPRMQPLQPEDGLDVRRLWHRVTPRPVLQAEQSEDPTGASLSFGATFSDAERRYVLRSHRGEIWGYLHMLLRPRGAWLCLMVHPDAGDSAAEILGHALAVLEDRPQPVYCAVREYEGGMQGVLVERGFAPGDTYSLLVKHTTVRVREPRPKLVPALEKRVEVAPTVSRSETGDR